MASELINFEQMIMTGPDVKRIFDASYLRTLYQKHCVEDGLDQKYLINFIHTAQVTDANPLRNQIYLIARNSKIKGKNGAQDTWVKIGTIVYSYQYFLGLIQSHVQYGGMDTVLSVKKKIVPKFAKVKDTYGKDKWEHSTFEFDEKNELCSTTTIFRNGKQYTYEAWFSDYCDANNEKWRLNYSYMLRKCSEVGAARHAFADIIQGFYIEEEFSSEAKEHEAIETTGTQIENTERQKTIELADKKEEIFRDGVDKKDEIEMLMAKILESSKILMNGKTKEEKGAWMFDYLGVNNFNDLKKVGISFLKKLDQDLDEAVKELCLGKPAESKITTNEIPFN